MQKIIEPPTDYKPRRAGEGIAWCPYCGEERQFGYDARLKNARCVECGISEMDFYVRRFNRLWDDKTMDAYMAGATKSGRKWNKPYPWEKNKEIIQQEAKPTKERIAYCDLCGKEFTITGNRQKYCEGCATEIRRQKLAEYKRKEREQKTKPKAS